MNTLQSLFGMIRSNLRLGKRQLSNLQKKGYERERIKTEFVDSLSDDDLVELNRLLDWRCFTVDGCGRRFGNAAWKGKRTEPEAIPDRRILLMHECFDLRDKHIFEVGCFEGIHTVGLSMFARKVTAVDSRLENVVKTIVRCAFFNVHPTVFKWNIEEWPSSLELTRVDLAHHVGVLYHLKNPVQHLLNLGRHVCLGLMLDTHYALPHEATQQFQVNGKNYNYKHFRESGYADVFSGMYDHSKWLKLDDIIDVLRESGFAKVEVKETRRERNGPRVLLMASRG